MVEIKKQHIIDGYNYGSGHPKTTFRSIWFFKKTKLYHINNTSTCNRSKIEASSFVKGPAMVTSHTHKTHCIKPSG